MAVSGILGSSGTLLAKKFGASDIESFWWGLGSVLVVGVVKELYDTQKTNPTGFDGRDMLANSIGGVLGSGATFTLVKFNSGSW